MGGPNRNLEELLGTEGRSRLTDRLRRHLDLDQWGFILTHVTPVYGPVIYDSPRCRILCRLGMERDGDDIAIAYGRRHAPNKDATTEWNGERCLPWHNLAALNVIEFLEGISPAEVVERRRNRLDNPARIAFMKTHAGRHLVGADWSVALHAFIWKGYGDRLFSLFDLRESQRWEELRLFVKAYYELRPEAEGLSTEGLFGIPPWQIC